MHNGNTLLAAAEQVYVWLMAPGERLPLEQLPSTPSVERQQLGDARALLSTTWWNMLPLEREDKVDGLLEAYCTVCAGGSFDRDQILFNNVPAGPELGRRIPAERHDELALLGGVRATVDSITLLYKYTANPDLIHVASEVKAANTWSHRFLADLPLSRAARMGAPALFALVSELKAIEQALEATAMQHRALPLVANTLPDGENALARAQLAGQSGEDRFRILSRLLTAFVKLYSASNTRHHVSMAQKAREEAIVAAAVRLTENETSRTHFKSLSVDQQNYVISNARTLLYRAGGDLALHNTLPAATGVTHEVFQPLLHPHLDVPSETPDNMVGSAHPRVRLPILELQLGTLHSLAHDASASRQISDRKARRYYGTTARAWEAGKATGGL
ncbi:hypothetical protein JCM10450v2_006539 [Rhodotorula kratochvilovae]